MLLPIATRVRQPVAATALFNTAFQLADNGLHSHSLSLFGGCIIAWNHDAVSTWPLFISRLVEIELNPETLLLDDPA